MYPFVYDSRVVVVCCNSFTYVWLIIRPRQKYKNTAMFTTNSIAIFSMNHAEQCDNEMQNAIEWECNTYKTKTKLDANPLKTDYGQGSNWHARNVAFDHHNCIRDMLIQLMVTYTYVARYRQTTARAHFISLALLMYWTDQERCLFLPLPLPVCLSACVCLSVKFNRCIQNSGGGHGNNFKIEWYGKLRCACARNFVLFCLLLCSARIKLISLNSRLIFFPEPNSFTVLYNNLSTIV